MSNPSEPVRIEVEFVSDAIDERETASEPCDTPAESPADRPPDGPEPQPIEPGRASDH